MLRFGNKSLCLWNSFLLQEEQPTQCNKKQTFSQWQWVNGGCWAPGVGVLPGPGWCHEQQSTAQVGCEWCKARALHLLWEQFLLLLYEPWTLWHSAWGGSFSCLVLDVNVKVSAAFTCAAFYCCLIILHLSFVFFTCASGFVCRSRLLELVCMLKSLLL